MASNPRVKTETQGWPFLLFIILLGLELRVYHLVYLSLWQDESFTRFYSENSLSYLWTTGFRWETNPPLYYTVMHYWMHLFGASECALRSFSVVASVIALPIVYTLGKELEGRRLGLLAALLMALSPTEIWYAQEARCYAVLQVEISLALLGLARYLANPNAAGNLVLYVLGATLAAYTHDTAIFFVVACSLAVLAVALKDRYFSARKLIPWIAANITVGLATLPLCLAMFSLAGSDNLSWIPPINFLRFANMVDELVGGTSANHEYYFLRGFSFLLLLPLAGYWYQHRRMDQRSVVVLLLVPLIFIGLTLAVSIHRPILLVRVLLWLVVPLSLLLAHVLIQAGNKRLPLVIMTMLVLVIGLYGQLFPYFSPKENWRDLSAANQQQFSRAELIVLSSTKPIAGLAYYIPSSVGRMAYWPQDGKLLAPACTQSYYLHQFNVTTIQTKDLLAAIKTGKPVCLILSDDGELLPQIWTLLPPPNYRFDDIFPNQYGFHLLFWQSSPAPKAAAAQRNAPLFATNHHGISPCSSR